MKSDDPLDPAGAAGAAHPARMAHLDSTTSHVLVVDDDPHVCSLVCEYLQQNDFRATAVHTGKQMLEVIGREAIDLLLLDLRLPGEDGLRLAQTVRESSGVPIMILTGRIEEADRVMGLELGADDYVTKPFSPALAHGSGHSRA
jgi:two-component system, OmpR family, response regulator